MAHPHPRLRATASRSRRRRLRWQQNPRRQSRATPILRTAPTAARTVVPTAATQDMGPRRTVYRSRSTRVPAIPIFPRCRLASLHRWRGLPGARRHHRLRPHPTSRPRRIRPAIAHRLAQQARFPTAAHADALPRANWRAECAHHQPARFQMTLLVPRDCSAGLRRPRRPVPSRMSRVGDEMRRVDADLGHGAVVLRFQIGIEDDVEIRRAVQPAVRLDLAFQLPRRPSRVTEC